MTVSPLCEKLLKLDWYPGSIELELKMYSMTKTPKYKAMAAGAIRHALDKWLLAYKKYEYDGVAPASKKERQFYELTKDWS